MLWNSSRDRAWADLEEVPADVGHSGFSFACVDATEEASFAFGLAVRELDWVQSGMACGEPRAAAANVVGASSWCSAPRCAADATAVKVFVETLAGKMVTLNVDACGRVATTKAKIATNIALAIVYQRLLFAGNQLDDNEFRAMFVSANGPRCML